MKKLAFFLVIILAFTIAAPTIGIARDYNYGYRNYGYRNHGSHNRGFKRHSFKHHQYHNDRHHHGYYKPYYSYRPDYYSYGHYPYAYSYRPDYYSYGYYPYTYPFFSFGIVIKQQMLTDKTWMFYLVFPFIKKVQLQCIRINGLFFCMNLENTCTHDLALPQQIQSFVSLTQ